MTQATDEQKPLIFIVEDDFTLGKMLQEILSNYYQTILSTHGKNVLDVLAEHPVELLLLDIMLPEIHGFALLERIRAIYAPEDLPIIIISARDDASSIVHGFEAGANDYIVKPVKNSVILARIETQLKLSRLQREHKQHIAYLEDNETLRQQLSKIASHDLKNPLNNLRLVAELLSEETSKHPRIQPLLKTMNASLDMMDEIVASFVDVVEIQTRNITLDLQAVEMYIIIMNALMQYELTATRKNIEMKIGSTDGVVYVDEARTAQIVGNLLSNAIKYSPRDSVIKIFSEIRDNYVRLCIADTGKGVPEEERHLLFEEFADISTRPTDGENSTGFGLWIVRHLTELQGGRVGAEFPETGGSIFWVEFPAYNA